MNEKQTSAPGKIRPTKKQKELLSFIDTFISEHGYSPSYREIMSGLNYTSVATVALHVNNLIKRGHLIKRENSARSLEVVREVKETKVSTNQVAPAEEKWLVEKVEHAFMQVETSGTEVIKANINNLYILINALKILSLEGAAQSFVPRLAALKDRSPERENA